jgi:hypothetical protein
MRRRLVRWCATLFATAAACPPTPLAAQRYDDALLTELRWRHIGPFRGGRTKAARTVKN